MGSLSRFLGIAVAVGSSALFAQTASGQSVTSEARTHFAAGVNLLKDPARPRYEEAYREFKTAYGIAPVAQILGNLGLCAMMLERDAEAIDAYEKYLAGMIDLPPREREQVERDLSTLKVGVTRITITSNVKGATLIDQRVRTQGEPVTNVYGPIDGPLSLGIRQGHHVFTLRAQGKPPQVWEFDAAAGEVPPHAFEFPTDQPQAAVKHVPIAPRPAERPIPKSFWYTAGVTGVLGIATAVTGISAMRMHADFESANTGNTPERAGDMRGTGQALNITTDVLLAATIVGAAVGTIIYLTRPEKTSTTPTTARLTGPLLLPSRGLQ